MPTRGDNTRVFGGKEYRLYAFGGSRKELEKDAERYRKSFGSQMKYRITQQKDPSGRGVRNILWIRKSE